MSPTYLWYQVHPTEAQPEGMAPVIFTILSPVWQGPEITIRFPDGWEQTLTGCTAAACACDVRVFWTEASPGGPPVCMVIGGEGGIKIVEGQSGTPLAQRRESCRPFLALATPLIPSWVRQIIGPEPERSPRLLA